MGSTGETGRDCDGRATGGTVETRRRDPRLGPGSVAGITPVSRVSPIRAAAAAAAAAREWRRGETAGYGYPHAERVLRILRGE